MILPKPGTQEHREFMRKSLDPNSHQAHILRQMVDETSVDTQKQVRSMLQSMIELVPGQLFRDVARFHAKFGLEPTNEETHTLPEDLLAFRIKFMIEELIEYATACGAWIRVWEEEGQHVYKVYVDPQAKVDMEKAFDGLIDLMYVALGTAFLHRFPFNDGWDRVQAANMAKERASGADDERSTRKHSADIVKPAGWKAPTLKDLIGPYAQIHAILRNHENVHALLVVESPCVAKKVQADFDVNRCKVVYYGQDENSIYDIVFVACEYYDEYRAVLMRNLSEGGRLVLMAKCRDTKE